MRYSCFLFGDVSFFVTLQLLSAQGGHEVLFDYRSFSGTTSIPTKNGHGHSCDHVTAMGNFIRKYGHNQLIYIQLVVVLRIAPCLIGHMVTAVTVTVQSYSGFEVYCIAQ